MRLLGEIGKGINKKRGLINSLQKTLTGNSDFTQFSLQFRYEVRQIILNRVPQNIEINGIITVN